LLLISRQPILLVKEFLLMVFSNEAIGLHCCSCFVVLIMLIALELHLYDGVNVIGHSLGIGKKVNFDELLYSVE
jgi:hypothetical protein